MGHYASEVSKPNPGELARFKDEWRKQQAAERERWKHVRDHLADISDKELLSEMLRRASS